MYFREESFEDELRALELEERRLALQAKKAKVVRANDYIDAELRDSAARTDVIQSEADATRNVSFRCQVADGRHRRGRGQSFQQPVRRVNRHTAGSQTAAEPVL